MRADKCRYIESGGKLLCIDVITSRADNTNYSSSKRKDVSEMANEDISEYIGKSKISFRKQNKLLANFINTHKLYQTALIIPKIKL